jgi:WS/DGAT/MGAT family acyltransferase
MTRVRIERLSALDQLMVDASVRWPQDVGALAFLDGRGLFDRAGRFRLATARAAIAARLDLVPRLRQLILVPRRGLGGPLWVDDPAFDLARHVRELALPAPVDDATVLATVEGIRRQRMVESRPLWELWFLTGLPERRIAMYVRLHHAVADGMAAMSIVRAFLDARPGVARPGPVHWRPQPPPTDRQLRADRRRARAAALDAVLDGIVHPQALFAAVRGALPGIREVFMARPATRTSLDRLVGPGRSSAVLEVDLATLKAAARPSGATVTDVVLTALAGGVRRHLQSGGESVDRATLKVYLPVSLRPRASGVQVGNRIAQMVVPLPIAAGDPRCRLERITAATTRRKATPRPSLSAPVFSGILGRILLGLAMRQRVNITAASIQGPPDPLYLLHARILDVIPLLPLVADETVGVGALSYAGTLAVSVVADADTIPELGPLMDGMRADLEMLGVPCGRLIVAPSREAAGASPGSAPSAAGAMRPVRADRRLRGHSTSVPPSAPRRPTPGAAPCP